MCEYLLTEVSRIKILLIFLIKGIVHQFLIYKKKFISQQKKYFLKKVYLDKITDSKYEKNGAQSQSLLHIYNRYNSSQSRRIDFEHRRIFSIISSQSSFVKKQTFYIYQSGRTIPLSIFYGAAFCRTWIGVSRVRFWSGKSRCEIGYCHYSNFEAIENFRYNTSKVWT